MTDAVVSALEHIMGVAGDEAETACAALPIAREMAERERELERELAALTAQGEAFASVHVVMREGPFPIRAVHDSRAGAEADAAMRGEDYEVETWRIQRDAPAPSAPPARRDE